MIRLCRDRNDLSPLAPLTQKDVIWLNALERMKQKEADELELAKSKVDNLKFEANRELMTAMILVVQDVRKICFSQLPFSSNSQMDNYINNLPSMKDKKEEHGTIPHGTVRKLEPGEVPKWLQEMREKKALAQNTKPQPPEK